jgi:hypothetical protein
MLRAKLQLVCDDLRVEEGTRKLLVIGLYLDTLVVPTLPITLPLTFFTAYEVDELRLFHLSGQLSGPSGDVGPRVALDLDVQQSGTVISIVKMVVQFETLGDYRFVLSEPRNGQGIEIVKTFSVILASQERGEHG